MKALVIFLSIFLAACNKSEKIQSNVVTNFDVNKYLGNWYEIARTDNRFEKGCTDVKANYSLREGDGLNVVNKCSVGDKEKIATGKAYFKNSSNIGALKVTFFWPFYGNYNITYLDEKYQYAIVDGGNADYLWILARKKSIDDMVLRILLDKIKQSGFEPNSLIYTKHHD